MACFSHFKLDHRISKGVVHPFGCKQKIYCEIWSVDYHKYELRMMIKNRSKKVYRDVHLTNVTGNNKFTFKNSWLCHPIKLTGRYDIDMGSVEKIARHILIVDTNKQDCDKTKYYNIHH